MGTRHVFLALVALTPFVSRSIERDTVALLDGVDAIASPGVPGSVCAFGPDAFPLVVGKKGVPVVAASRTGRARVVVFGHGGFLGPDALEAHDTGLFLENALRWAGDEDEPTVVCSDPRLAGWLEGRGFTLVLDAATADVLVRDIGSPLGAVNEIALAKTVENGTGLICAATGWGWLQLNPGRDLAHDFDGNRLLAPYGLAIGSETAKDSVTDGFRTGTPPELAQAGSAWRGLERNTLQGDDAHAAEARVLAAMNCLPADEPLLIAPLVKKLARLETRWRKQPSLGGEPLDRLLVRYLHGRWSALPADEVKASPTAAQFPGSVAPTADRSSARVTVDGATVGWHGTGLYAAPGEAIRVRLRSSSLPPGTRVRIGCHKDRLWSKAEWKRWPEISLAFPFEQDVPLVIASPHGGLVYVELAHTSPEPFEIEIDDAVHAPRFVLGHDDPAEWARTLEQSPAPWGEIEGQHLIHSLPRGALAKVTDPAAVATFWDSVWEAHVALGGRPFVDGVKRPERIVADIQISAGYMHSGYPIMTHLESAHHAVDVETLAKEGNWGHFHELGHNAQRPDWTFGGTTEVTCNLFTLYAMEKVCGIPTGEHPRAIDGLAKAEAYLADGGDFTRWKREPFLALAMYVQLQQEFGWELFEEVFREYLTLTKNERPKGDAAKRDQWCVRLSRHVGRDLSPFFERWAVPVGAQAAESLADLPAWPGP
jgi:hypothetical protein